MPATFLTTQNSFTTGIANPANFNPLASNIDYIPADTRWPMIQSWFFSVQRELTKNTVLEVATTATTARGCRSSRDYNQAVPNLPGQTLGVQARRPDPGFRPDHVAGSGGLAITTTASRRAFEHRVERRSVLPEFVHLVESAGRFRAGAGILRRLLRGESAEHSQPGRRKEGPTSFDVKLINVTSVVYQLPFGKGRRFGASMNPVFGCSRGRLGDQRHQHRQHRHAAGCVVTRRPRRTT